MITIHIGAHKTGSSFIQKRMSQNRPLFGNDYQTMLRKDLPLFALVAELYAIKTREQALAAQGTITQLALLLGQYCADIPNILVSSEDLLGPLPSRHGILGLYPFADITLAAMAKGLEQAQVPFQFAFYQRNYPDWIGSVYRFKFRNQPDRPFAPQRFKKRHGLPQNWDDTVARIQHAVGAHRCHLLSFEQDRASGNLGTALFDISGLPRDIQDRFAPLDPVNVSQKATVDPKHRNAP